MTAIAVSRIHYPVTTLGPGRRLGVWTQGCSIRCPGCVSADTWAFDRGVTTVDGLVAAVGPWLAEAEGITVSGGEPFDQPEALFALLRAFRARTSVDVLVFSGHPIEAIAPWITAMDGFIDAVIADPYLESASQTLPLRGSDNQRLHLITDLGRRRFSTFEQPSIPERRFDVMFDADGQVFLAGIPARGDLARLRAALGAAGHAAWISQAPESSQ
jgi:anaerobic ribonucleoside-triphosphate reductase activating protein